ncbi:ABC transporter ATP-binding protein [Paenibacillus cymbidii]|uniref:ABC transporter ATP-binding protein n=1 Tax=Paenibacillus cymbidii TaxID=1639034 RepID=UPI00108170C3|nr:ABC transporter ATP-binding protein [Paenibacillus cymbidii]
MIELHNISKSFPQRTGGRYVAVEQIDLTIGKGEFVSLLGPSGCGKSTLLNLVAGLERPDQGTATIHGKPIVKPGADRVVVFQEHALFPWLTVQDNVAFGLKQKGVPKKERLALATEHIKSVHLGKFADRYPHELSGGMKQRASIARALAMDPDVLLMDEPFSALDEQTRMILHKDLEDIWMRTGKTILFITHNIREAVLLSDRVVVMATQPGRIKREFPIHSARPRLLGDSVLHRAESSILEELAEELEKVLKEEMGDGYRLKKDAFYRDPAGGVGDGI